MRRMTGTTTIAEWTADHHLRADLSDERHEVIGDSDINLTLGIGLNITEVTDVTILIAGCTMCFSEWIEVRTSRGTAIGEITKLKGEGSNKDSCQHAVHVS